MIMNDSFDDSFQRFMHMYGSLRLCECTTIKSESERERKKERGTKKDREAERQRACAIT